MRLAGRMCRIKFGVFTYFSIPREQYVKNSLTKTDPVFGLPKAFRISLIATEGSDMLSGDVNYMLNGYHYSFRNLSLPYMEKVMVLSYFAI
jgi:hypothetical protein